MRKNKIRNWRLAAILARRGMTIVQLARLAGVGRSAISAIMNYRAGVEPANADKICKVLNTTPEKLGIELYPCDRRHFSKKSNAIGVAAVELKGGAHAN